MSAIDELLNAGKVRTTDEAVKRVALYDVMQRVLKCTSSNASTVLKRIVKDHPEVNEVVSMVKFPGAGQRVTPVTDFKGLLLVLQILPGKRAEHFRKYCVPTLEKHLFSECEVEKDKIDKVLGVMQTCPNFESHNTIEAQVSCTLSSVLHGKREVENKYGIADVITPELVIEVKTASLWKHALGQVLAYARAFPKLRPCVHLFGSDDELFQIKRRARQCCLVYGVVMSTSVICNKEVLCEEDTKNIAHAAKLLKAIRRKKKYASDRKEVQTILKTIVKQKRPDYKKRVRDLENQNAELEARAQALKEVAEARANTYIVTASTMVVNNK